jgi:hypothetical protein
MIIKKKIALRFILIFGMIFMMNNRSLQAQETDYKSYSLFVYSFMKYIEWPEAQSKGEFIVGVFGDSPIMKELQTLAATKKLKGRTIVIKKFATPEECGKCHLLYISGSKSSTIKTLKETLKTEPVLIVAEREGLAKKGAGLSFVTMEDDGLKFDINKAEIEQHNLKISSSLISLGNVVG